MSDAVTVNEHGTILVDLAKAEQLLAGMPIETQLAMTNAIFEPILNNGLKMKKALEEIRDHSGDDFAVQVAQEGLPK